MYWLSTVGEMLTYKKNPRELEKAPIHEVVSMERDRTKSQEKKRAT